MKVQVIGAGSWGLALARLLALKGHEVSLACREEDGPEVLRTKRESPCFLPGVRIPESIRVAKEHDPAAAIAVFAAPSHAMRAVAAEFPFNPDTIRVSVAKGIETETLMRMTEVITAEQGACPVTALSGPSHAEEVATDHPVSVVVAGVSEHACKMVQDAFVTSRFRVYTSPDVLGVELGGALKNIIAIAAGVCDGFEFGDSAKAALVTRGLAEMARLGEAMGAHPLTFSGLSGMGDLIVTCMSRYSRNRDVGERIARGETMESITSTSLMVAEGVRTAPGAYAMAQKHGVDMPITEQVYRVLFEEGSPRDAVEDLMGRDAKAERG